MFVHPWNKKLNFLLTTLFAALLFFVPLVFWPTSELFEFNKMMLTYLLTGMILVAFLSQAILNKKLTLRRTPLDLPLLLFLLGQVISTLFSINPHTSIWGYYSRFHGGLASTISYLVLFYIFVSHFSEEENKPQLRFIFYSLITSTTLVALYGVLEHFGIDKNLWVQDVQSRVFSTLGQPNWLSAYLVAILPLPLYLAFSTKRKLVSLGFVLLAAIYLLTIFFTKSRSGIATTSIVLALIFCHQLSLYLIRKTKLSVSIFLFGTLVVGTLSILTFFYLKPNLIQKVIPYGVSDLRQLVEQDNLGRTGGSDSMVIRAVVWQGAINLFKRHPLVGTGPETFGYSYYWVRPAEHNLLSEWDFLYNKAHNEYLNLLATTGLFGLLPYLLLILTTLYLFYKQIITNNTPVNYHLIAAINVGYLSILITNYFGFSVVPIALLFFLYPALLIVHLQDPQFIFFGKGWSMTKKQLKLSKKGGHTIEPNLYQYLGLTFLVFFLIYWVFLLRNHWVADLKYNKGKAYSQAGYLSQSLPLLEKAVDLYPSEPTFRSSLAETYATSALATRQQFDSLPATESANLKEASLNQEALYTKLALENIDLVVKQNPWHLNFVKAQAKIYLTLAQLDPNYYQNALKSLLKANELAPTDSKIVYNIGLLYLQLGDDSQAKTAMSLAVNLKPNYDQALIELIKLLSQTAKEDAQKYLDQLLQYYPNHQGAGELQQLID